MPSHEDAGQQPATEEFKLLDVDTSSTTTTPPYRSTAGVIAGGGDTPLADKLSRLAFTGVNVVFTCSAIAVAKQLVNPANYSPSDAAAQEASKALPSWFAGQYQQRRVASEMTQRVMRDTGVLMAASGMWYGLQFALRKLRGEHDAFNVCVAGTVSAGFLGATFIEPHKLSRAGLWGAVGGLLGYYGYREQQALRAALLQRQQELEQKHMRVDADRVQDKLDPKLLTELLKLEQKERQEQLRSQMNKHGIQVPAAAGAGSDSSSSSSSGPSSAWPGAADGGSDAGSQPAGDDQQWHKLLNSAPWLQDEDNSDNPQ